MNLAAFKAYDIRGRIPEELNEELAYDIGRAYAAFCRLRASPVEAVVFLKTELAAAGPAVTDQEKQRHSWGIWLLEDLDTPASRKTLQALATGNPASATLDQGAEMLQRAVNHQPFSGLKF